MECVFRARHPHLEQIGDVELGFVVGDVASPEARDLIRRSAADPRVMLTVAVCVEDPDASLSIALNLPEEVYRWNLSGGAVPEHPHRARWKADGNNVWVRQSLVAGFSDALKLDRGRYAWVSPFGMSAEVLSDRSFAEHSAMVRGYMYARYHESGSRESDAAERLVEELRVDAPRVLDESFSRFLGTKWPHRWANVHADDAIATFLAFLGLRAVPDRSLVEDADRSAFDVGEGFRERLEANLFAFPATSSGFSALARRRGFSEDDFAEAEHRRWMADRTLAGFRQAGFREEKDEEFLIHHSFRPFWRIATQNNDRNNVLAIPVFLALEGYRIEEAAERSEQTVGPSSAPPSSGARTNGPERPLRVHDVFISYCRHDLAVVKAIKQKLELKGYSCWMDLEGIESGSPDFRANVEAAIVSSDVFLFFLSSASQASKWACWELERADARKKRIVLVRLDDCMTDAFSARFGHSDIIDWRIDEQRRKLFFDLGNWTWGPLPPCSRDGVEKALSTRGIWAPAKAFMEERGIWDDFSLANCIEANNPATRVVIDWLLERRLCTREDLLAVFAEARIPRRFTRLAFKNALSAKSHVLWRRFKAHMIASKAWESFEKAESIAEDDPAFRSVREFLVSEFNNDNNEINAVLTMAAKPFSR